MELNDVPISGNLVLNLFLGCFQFGLIQIQFLENIFRWISKFRLEIIRFVIASYLKGIVMFRLIRDEGFLALPNVIGKSLTEISRECRLYRIRLFENQIKSRFLILIDDLDEILADGIV